MDPLAQSVLDCLRSCGPMSAAEIGLDINQRARIGVLADLGEGLIGAAAVDEALRSLVAMGRVEWNGEAWEFVPERQAVEAKVERQISMF